jgi:hypothetical protein
MSAFNVRTFVFSCAALAASSLPVVLAAAPTQTPLPYASIRAVLRASGVPVLLPRRLPRAIGPIRSVAVIGVGPDGYYVGFSPLASCGGGLSCAFFHVAGSQPTRPAAALAPRSRRIRLPDGTRAVFAPEDCSGAGCTEASLTFARHGANYELDVRGGRASLGVLEAVYAGLARYR